jgi:hypothetical protein
MYYCLCRKLVVVFALYLTGMLVPSVHADVELFVSPEGNDSNIGNVKNTIKNLKRTKAAVRKLDMSPWSIAVAKAKIITGRCEKCRKPEKKTVRHEKIGKFFKKGTFIH